ncbi:hypothetical protein BH11ACT1_BH11ACT1_18090 [soil metagenome]
MTCTCVTVKEAAELGLAGLPIPTCADHDEPSADVEPDADGNPALALNDHAGLLGVLSRAIGADFTTTTIEGA